MICFHAQTYEFSKREWYVCLKEFDLLLGPSASRREAEEEAARGLEELSGDSDFHLIYV